MVILKAKFSSKDLIVYMIVSYFPCVYSIIWFHYVLYLKYFILMWVTYLNSTFICRSSICQRTCMKARAILVRRKCAELTPGSVNSNTHFSNIESNLYIVNHLTRNRGLWNVKCVALEIDSLFLVCLYDLKLFCGWEGERERELNAWISDDCGPPRERCD